MTIDPTRLDYAPLSGRVPLRARLRALSADNSLVIAATVSVPVLAVPIGLVVAPFFLGPPSGEIWAVILFFAVCGFFVVASFLADTGVNGALVGFARANGLEAVLARQGRHYTASPFAAGAEAVQRAVRTRGATFVEVGNRVATARLHDGEAVEPKAYLRVVLGAPLTHGSRGTRDLTRRLEPALGELVGGYRVEGSGDELTVLGERPIDLRSAHQVQEALTLATELAGLAEAELPTSPTLVKRVPEGRRGRAVRPWVVVLGTLALLVVVPLATAVVFSSIDGVLRGREALATLAVGVFVAVVLGLVRLGIRAATRGR